MNDNDEDFTIPRMFLIVLIAYEGGDHDVYINTEDIHVGTAVKGDVHNIIVIVRLTNDGAEFNRSQCTYTCPL